MTVYAVQEPMRRDHASGEMVPAVDLRPAGQWGAIDILLPSSMHMVNTAPAVRTLRSKLRDFGDEDYILAVGSPGAIGAAVAVAANMNRGRVKMLQWEKREKGYIEIHLDVHGGTV